MEQSFSVVAATEEAFSLAGTKGLKYCTCKLVENCKTFLFSFFRSQLYVELNMLNLFYFNVLKL